MNVWLVSAVFFITAPWQVRSNKPALRGGKDCASCGYLCQQRWHPPSYVRNVNRVYYNALKGIEMVVYLCGKGGLSKTKGQILESMISLILDLLKPLRNSEIVEFHDRLHETLQRKGTSKAREIITSEEDFMKEIEKINLLGVEYNEEDYLKNRREIPGVVWYLFHVLTVAKARQRITDEQTLNEVSSRFTATKIKDIFVNFSEECFYDLQFSNPFASCLFGKCEWISDDLETYNQNDVKDVFMGLVMWMWRVHNGVTVENSLAQTAAAYYKSFILPHGMDAKDYTGIDVRFPPLEACEKCRHKHIDHRKFITPRLVGIYSEMDTVMEDYDVFEDFSLKETYKFLVNYYEDSRWYTNSYDITWNESEQRFSYRLIGDESNASEI